MTLHSRSSFAEIDSAAAIHVNSLQLQRFRSGLRTGERGIQEWRLSVRQRSSTQRTGARLGSDFAGYSSWRRGQAE